MGFEGRTDKEIDQWIANHEVKECGTSSPLYLQLLEERAKRSHVNKKLKLESSLQHLKRAAVLQKYTTYGDLAAASEIEWSQARNQMNGPGGHLDRLLDICYARGLPLLTAICVNQDGLQDGELGDKALAGFVSGARRLGFSIADDRAFHHECRDKCLEWGREAKRSEELGE